ncbi:hypothetical protein V6N13_086413 [Hibiscus sabdariffa]|uniref:Uncharacterized protein n=1 Tax=Hibiscus sabdariffa TaxID=183260 RepID=A0ABR2FT63_9ROSI
MNSLCQRAVESIGSHKCSYMHCDVTVDEEQVKNLAELNGPKLRARRLDIMFSNAGIVSNSTQTILELNFARFGRLFAINARGMAAYMKHAMTDL